MWSSSAEMYCKEKSLYTYHFLLLFSGRCSGLLLQNIGQFICSGNQQEYLCRAVRRKSVPLFLIFVFMFSFMNMQSRYEYNKRLLLERYLERKKVLRCYMEWSCVYYNTLKMLDYMFVKIYFLIKNYK